MGRDCRLMTQTRLDIEPGGLSELENKSLTVDSRIFLGLFSVHTVKLQVSVNSERCWLESMVQGDLMGGTPRCTVY